jgi:hypothetical protein
MKRELRCGTVRHISMRTEDIGRARRLVAYFSLGELSARFVWDTVPSRSHKRLPAPFALGDPLILVGALDRAERRFEVSCALLVREGRTIEGYKPYASIEIGAMLLVLAVFLALGAVSDRSHGLAAMPVTAMVAGLGLWMLGGGIGRYKARKMAEAAASGHD